MSGQPELGCKESGIRYAGKTAGGVEACFTLTGDGKAWLEMGFRFLRGKDCPNPPASLYMTEPFEGTNPVRLDFANGDFVTGKVRGKGASGVISQSDFCRGKKLDWSARARQTVPAQALRNLARSAATEPFAATPCKERGIRYTGKATQGGVEVCFTLNSYRSSLIETGWSFGRGSGCGADMAGVTMQSTDKSDLDAVGNFDDAGGSTGLSGTVRGVRASGVLTDLENCPTKTFRWTARRTP